MEEAERLCDRVAIVDHGRMIAEGTPRELIASLGAEHVLEFAIADDGRLDTGAIGRGRRRRASRAGTTAPGGSRCRSSTRPCPRCSVSSGGRVPSCRSCGPIRRRSRTSSSPSPDDSFVTSRHRALARPPAGPAHAGTLPRVLSRARGGLLGLHLPSAADRRPRHRVPEPAAGAHSGRARGARPARTTRWPRGLAAADGIRLRTLDDSAAAQALRTGDVALVVRPAGGGRRVPLRSGAPDAREARLRVDAGGAAGRGARRPGPDDRA